MDTSNTKVKTLQLSFDLDIHAGQLSKWRGAFIEMAGWEDDRFHNHKGEKGYHYRYPVIQYRMNKGQAGLLAINEGIEAVQQVLAQNDWVLRWEGQRRELKIADLKMSEPEIRVQEDPLPYRIYKWVALNQENLKKWDACASLVERIQLLEPLLANHLVAGLWGLGWDGKERIEVNIQHLHNSTPVRIHGIKFLAFDLSFSANVRIPFHVGIGKGVSHGQGRIGPMLQERKQVRNGRNKLSRNANYTSRSLS